MQNHSKHHIISEIVTLNNELYSSPDRVFPWQYQPVKNTYPHPDCGCYTTYGLALYQCQNQQRILVDTIADISTCQDYVENLALTFTIHQLSPVHFHDAVLDAIRE